MHDTLTDVRDRVIVYAELAGVGVQCGNLNTAVFRHLIWVFAPRCGGNVVIRNRDGLVRGMHFAARHAQAFECLRAGHFVNQMAVNIEQTGAVFGLLRDMRVPDLVVECFGGHRSSPVCG